MKQTITYYQLYIRVPNPTLGSHPTLVNILGDTETEENYKSMEKAKSRVTELFNKVKSEYNNDIYLEFLGDNVNNCFPQFKIEPMKMIGLDMSIRKKHITFIE